MDKNEKLIAALTRDLHRAYYAGNDAAVKVIAERLAQAKERAAEEKHHFEMVEREAKFGVGRQGR